MLRPLPVAFRLVTARGRAAEARRCLNDVLPLLSRGDKFPGAAAGAGGARHWAWCGAWQLPVDDRALKLAAAAVPDGEAAEFREWLNRGVAAGVVARQEVASMLPVALLGVRPHHAILDLCASPGSKTTQAVDLLHTSAPARVGSGSGSSSDNSSDGDGDSDSEGGAEARGAAGALPRGFMIANELCPTRAHVLAKRCTDQHDAAVSAAVTSHRAQIYPCAVSAGAGAFHRVICDVPCSGDGTFRKYRDKWGHWQPHQGRQLHSLQLQIALRGLALLRVGGARRPL